MAKKTKALAGADENTPSRSQYFSWINNTNEGSTEKQTLINLDYFKWLHDKYGMQLDIYAWDAGNLDGAGMAYWSPDSAKIKAQYPNDYAPLAKAAAEIGTRLGIWGGPDGFGDTPEQEAQRKERIISLCRDYNFALFKLDGVCGDVRKEKVDAFCEEMTECRKYCPDLIVLNHRLWLGGKGLKHATTFLWQGGETYVDVHTCNWRNAPHHRAFIFTRGNVPGLKRLAEDHGVCISSCIDYFEDDMIFQAFGRCLILAPEVYGNPWLMRDDEHAHMAHIYNLHKRYSDILVKGMLLPEKYGLNAVSRGSRNHRFLVLGNPTWKPLTVKMKLDKEIGLQKCKGVSVRLRHPFEQYIGEFEYGKTATVTVEPFRAALVEVCAADIAEPMLTNCEYEVLHDAKGTPDKIKIVSVSGKVEYTDGRPFAPADGVLPFDNTNRVPVKLGTTKKCAVPKNAEQIYETTLFASDNDSFEARSLRRSGETEIPCVKAARDAFFNQETYIVRGCEGRYAFDGNKDTFFDGQSRYYHYLRMDGGCLRVDFGDVYTADEVLIEYFDVNKNEQTPEAKCNILPPEGTFGTDLINWDKTTIGTVSDVEKTTCKATLDRVHTAYTVGGTRKVVTYPINGKIRYLRLPCPMDRIYKIALVRDGKELELKNPKVSNLLPDYSVHPATAAQKITVHIDGKLLRKDSFLAIGVDGIHGRDAVFAAVKIGDKFYGCPDRAASYRVNMWEFRASPIDRAYTYYLPVTAEMADKDAEIWVIWTKQTKEEINYNCKVWLCDGNEEKQGIVADIQ